MLDWGASVIAAVQTLRSPWLDTVVRLVTHLGSEPFYLFAIPLLFWCVDERKAFRLAVIVSIAAFVNCWLKGLLHVARPFASHPELAVVREVGYSTPSFHAQISATFWGTAAALWRRPIFVVLAVVLPFILGATRVYLGVHYPTDVLLGWLLGGALAAAYACRGERLATSIDHLDGKHQATLLAGLTMIFCLLHPADVAPAASLFGTAAGYAWIGARFSASAGTTPAERVLRFVVGISVAVVLYLGLRAFLHGSGPVTAPLSRFVRYAAVGAWVSGAAPWLFLRLGWARAPQPGRATRE